MALSDYPQRWTPIPDPTVLTTQQLLREIMSVREIYDTRLGGMDKAIVLLQAQADKSPTPGELNIKIEEKLNGVILQFRERDIRFEQAATDHKLAIDAALLSAKEAVESQNKSSSLAVSKSEMATTKQIDQISTSIQALERSVMDKVSDVKDRLNLIEGHAKGIGDFWGYIVGGIGLVVGIIGIALVFVKR